MKIKYFGKVTNGNLKVYNRKLFDKELLLYEGKEVSIIIDRKRKTRSIEQNAYLHLMFTIVTTELNNLGNKFTMEQVKELLKFKFLVIDEYDESTGEVIGQRVKGTSELTTTELSVFIEEVIRYCAETFHIQVPFPNEQISIEY